MAAVTKDSGQIGDVLISPKGREYVLRGRVTTANVARLQPVVVDASVAKDPRWDCNVKPAAAEIAVLGIALHAANVGETVEFVTQGELCGFSGLTPGALLSITGGSLDSTAATAAVFYLAYVLNATTIYFRA
jgi:hypothetical protein